MPVTLTLNPSVTVSSVTFGVQITPNGTAPALASNLGFTADPSVPGPLVTASATNLGVFWSSFQIPLSGTVTLGTLIVPVPASAVVGQTYTLQITGPSGALNGTSTSLGPGTNGTLTVAILTYLVGDVYPYTSDTAPDFGLGTGVLNTLDLISQLRAVTGLPGDVPATCSDRFDAMDTYPVDGSNYPTILKGRPGGDGVLNTLDLLEELKRVTSIDLSRPSRTQRGPADFTEEGLTCSSSSSQVPAARRATEGPPEATLEIVGNEVYVSADHDLTLAGLAFSLASADGSAIGWIPADGLAPSLLDSGRPGALSVAWLESLTLRGGERLRLGRVEGSVSWKVHGISANESEKAGGREVRMAGGSKQ
jgi:hypothetical protein